MIAPMHSHINSVDFIKYRSLIIDFQKKFEHINVYEILMNNILNNL